MLCELTGGVCDRSRVAELVAQIKRLGEISAPAIKDAIDAPNQPGFWGLSKMTVACDVQAVKMQHDLNSIACSNCPHRT